MLTVPLQVRSLPVTTRCPMSTEAPGPICHPQICRYQACRTVYDGICATTWLVTYPIAAKHIGQIRAAIQRCACHSAHLGEKRACWVGGARGDEGGASAESSSERVTPCSVCCSIA